MVKKSPLQDCLNKVIALKQEGLSMEQIKEKLLQSGVPINLTEETITEWKKIRNEKKRNNGFIYSGIGIVLLSTGFLFTLLLFNSSGPYHFALYGLTIIGLILVFKGMIDLMS
jgi:hypothetical protein